MALIKSLLVIGKSENRRYLRKFKPVLPYKASAKACMTTKCLMKFDSTRKKKTLLLLDNSSVHNFKLHELQNIEILLLPANQISLCQPADQGIIGWIPEC